ncbi:MAG: dienelactone hydrolase family protein [Myxococcota bacterium]
MALARAGSEHEFTAGGHTVPAYLAVPASRRGSGVLVVQEAWGLVDHVRDVCDRLAREGFVALAPDLYRGRTAAGREEAARLVAELDVDAAARDLDGAVGELLNQDATEGPKVGAVGFCMGGQLALLAGTRNRRIGAVVDFYGVHPQLELDLALLEAPVLAIFGDRDEFVSPDAVRALQAQFEAAGKPATFRIQPDAGHAFMNDSRPDAYVAAAAVAGWDAMLAFLRAELA